MNISSNYREISREEAQALEIELADAWKNPTIPQSQYDLAAKNELVKYRQGASCAPFDAFVQCLLKIPDGLSLLDVGASAGYYGEILKIAGFKHKYTAVDYSPHFEALAKQLYPDIEFHVANATQLPFPDASYDIVVSGCCMLSSMHYESMIREAARVSKKYVLFHRTPTLRQSPTRYYVKEAYGIPCLEVHFSEQELYSLFFKYGLECLYTHIVFWSEQEQFGHKEFLVVKRT